MSLTLQILPESESVRVRLFLREIFKPSVEAMFLLPKHLNWKYWEPHPYWVGGRSYAYFDELGNIASHAAVWPFVLLTKDKTLSGVHPIDWGASRRIRGSGAALLKEVRALRDVCFCIGGTEIALAVVRQSGFKPVARMEMMVCPLRPMRQLMTHQRRNWKLPARLVRNAMWVLGTASVSAGWTTEPVLPEQIPASVLPTPSIDLAVAARSSALFAYLAKCPIARHQFWLVRKGGELKGYFLLSFVTGQARIADAWMVSPETEGWRNLYALALQAARGDSSVAEIQTCATYGPAIEGAKACGFHIYGHEEVMLYDLSGQVAHIPHLHLQMIENDMSFLNEGMYAYIT